MLGKCVRAKIVKSIGSTDDTGFTYPLNYGKIYNTEDEYAFVMGVDHAVSNFDGRVIAVLNSIDGRKKPIWIIAPKSTRFINIDILKMINIERDFPNYNLRCLYESSSGAVVYRNINGTIRYLLIKNKRSEHWGFPKGHIEMGEDAVAAAKREVLEEAGIHIDIHDGFKEVSEYKIRDSIDKRVTVFVGTTNDDRTIIQKSEIDDYVWLPYERAANNLKFVNDKRILKEAKKFLIKNNYITEED